MAEPERAVSIHRRKVLPIIPPEQLPVLTATRKNPLIISVSELGAFLRCRQRWYLGYMAGLRRKSEGSPLRAIGISVHDILEQWYLIPYSTRYTPDAMARVVGKRIKLLKDMGIRDPKVRAMVVDMCNGYARWARKDDKRIGLRECAPEEWFELPLTEDGAIVVRGKIDNRFEPRVLKKTLACQETKTKGGFDVALLDLNFQLTTYLWAMKEKYPGYRRYQAYYTILRRMRPGPRVKNPLFFRTEGLERSPEEIDRWVADVRLMASDILAGPRIYPNVQDSCKWDCDFFNPCLLRGDPPNLKHVLKSEYTRGDKGKEKAKR